MADNKFALKVMCPDRTFFEGEADMVEMNTTEGYIGVYPGHIPIATVLAPGILVIHNDGELKRAALHSGFARISPDNIMILAEVAEWPDEIDLNRAEEARVRAERRLSGTESGIDIKRAEAALKRSLTRISIKG
ncbi:aTP synthase epsilon chain [Butyrivibrio sp. CAG:318]|jgi:F-type H+-transporting ATPase subunit epsilon|nr:aTP synthase epsilon chain [Butyrivibrio sp. CAG:318]